MKAELDWWVKNIHLCIRRSIIFASPQLIIASNAYLKGWGAFFPTAKDWGSIGIVRKQMSYSLELKAVKFENKSFTRMHPSVQSIHLQMDNLVAFSCLVKIGGGGGYTQQSSLIYKQRDLRLRAGQSYHNYSRIACRCSEQGT